MAKRVKRIRHIISGALAFLGREGELTVDLTNKSVRVHDGVTLGGTEQARADLGNVLAATGSKAGKMSAAQAAQLTTNTSNIATNSGNIASNAAAILTKANLTVPATPGNIALLDAVGDLADSGGGIADVLDRSQHTGQDDLTTAVTGILPIANGGTGASDAPTALTNLSGQPVNARLNEVSAFTPAIGKFVIADSTALALSPALTLGQVIFGNPATLSGFNIRQISALLAMCYGGLTGADGAKTVTTAETPADIIQQYTTYEINASQIVTPSDGRLIIFASQSITLNNGSKIDLKGAGAAGAAVRTPGSGPSSRDGLPGNAGSFGGSGGAGGGGNVGGLFKGGDGGALYREAGGLGADNAIGGNGNPSLITTKRFFYNLIAELVTTRAGGGGGGSGFAADTENGGGGGNGGGDLILIAPIITLNTGSIIDVSGNNAPAPQPTGSAGGGGGGGGGRITLITATGGLTNNATVVLSGGTGGSATFFGFAGGTGAAGYIENLEIL